MKAKRIVTLVCILLCLIMTFAVFSGCMNSLSLSNSTGLYLKTDNGTHMLISDNSPICLSNRTGDEHAFDNLTDGDEILVIHDGIAESYPAQTGAYFIKKTGDGEFADIPGEVISQLTELGWLKEKADIQPVPEKDEYEIVNIIDETKSGNLVTCDALEGFWSDGEYSYYFPSIKSQYITVYYEDGTEENILEAINSGRATIADLDRFEIGYYKEPADNSKE